MVVHILIGPPCSGKTTLAKQMLNDTPRLIRINRDDLRRMTLGKQKVNNGFIEQSINDITLRLLQQCMWADNDVVIDGTNCKAIYINEIKKAMPKMSSHGTTLNVTFKYIICDVPFWKQRWRNFWRWAKTGIWIPRSISVSMEHNFRNILQLIKTDQV